MIGVELLPPGEVPYDPLTDKPPLTEEDEAAARARARADLEAMKARHNLT